nr:hypothetical protein [Frankia gtarii]
MTDLFGSVAPAIIGLVTARDELRATLRRTGTTGVPVLAEATAMVSAYLAAEHDLHRIAPEADTDTLALMLIGGGHLLFAGRDGTAPGADTIHKVVSTAIADVTRFDR